MRERKYARNKAVEYAGKWAYSRIQSIIILI